MEIENRHKLATLMAAIAGVPDERFRYAGYSDEKMVGELVRLQPRPELLAKHIIDLGRVYGPDRMKEFEVKLGLAVSEISDGHGYLEILRRAKASLEDMLKNVPHGMMAMSAPFEDELPSITSVMSHIAAERD